MILGGTDLSQFGFFASQHPNSNIGLTGMCDMPNRLGKTYHSWADSRGVEPYVLSEEIIFGGRDIQLIGIIQGETKNITEANNSSLINLVNEFTDLSEFTTEFGTYQVYVKSIEATYLSDYAFEILINLREPVVDMPNDLPTPDAAQIGIDRISFAQLGGGLLRVAGDVRNRPALKPQDFTVWGKEGYQITKTEAPILNIEMYIEGNSYADFKGKINRLQALLASAGTRLIKAPNLSLREFFVTEGFKVTNMFSAENYFFGLVTIKAIEVFEREQNMGFLTTNGGDYITDNYSKKIKGYGRY